jgi:hypothetical protein
MSHVEPFDFIRATFIIHVFDYWIYDGHQQIPNELFPIVVVESYSIFIR